MMASVAALSSRSLTRSSGIRSAEKSSVVTGIGITRADVFGFGNSASVQEVIMRSLDTHCREKSGMRRPPLHILETMGRKVTITIDVTESGRKGGKARARNLSPKELTAGARTAANARWEQYYRDHPEKLEAQKEREARKTGKMGRPRKAKRKK
jgi:hypothetical protein